MKKAILLLFTLFQINIWGLEVAAPKAPPSVPLLGIKNIDLYLYQDVSTEGVPAIVRGKGDIYILPLNVGANLYSRGANIKLLGTTSEGLLSLLSSDVDDISELKGRKLYIGGQGSSPDVITKKILEDNEIDAHINYRSSPEIAKLLMSGRIENAILPEPLATMVLAKNSTMKRVEELKNLWDNSSIPQVGIFVQEKTLVREEREIDKFIETYKKNIENISDEDIENAIEKFGIKMSIGEFRSSIEYMNLGFKRDKESVEKYLNILGLEVEEDFYVW